MTEVVRVRECVEYREEMRVVDGVVARKDEKKWERKRVVVKRGDVVKSR